MRKKQKNVKLRNEKGKKIRIAKKSSQFLCHALFQAPHFISISLFKLSHLNSHTEPSPIALRFCDMYVCFFFVFISFAVWFRRRFPISFRFQFVKNFFLFFIFFPSFLLVFSYLNVLYVCMLYDWNERIIFLYFFSCSFMSVWEKFEIFFISLLFLLLFLHFDKSTLGK